jgi:hypothetical protein
MAEYIDLIGKEKTWSTRFRSLGEGASFPSAPESAVDQGMDGKGEDAGQQMFPSGRRLPRYLELDFAQGLIPLADFLHGAQYPHAKAPPIQGVVHCVVFRLLEFARGEHLEVELFNLFRERNKLTYAECRIMPTPFGSGPVRDHISLPLISLRP